MKIAYFDCQSGVSGDMVLGALIDLGVDLKKIVAGTKSLAIDGHEIKARKVKRAGLVGTKIDVVINRQKNSRPHSRNYSQIREIINGSALPKKVKTDSIKIFKMIGAAEAKVHGITIGKVHFHEVGAVDSIVDIVGAAIGFNLLDAGRVCVSPINTGEGTVECAHGILPVPAPATLELLKGVPCYSSGIRKELATPTGVAIIDYYANSYGSLPRMTVEETGYGAGGHIIEGLPNLLRVIVGRAQETPVSRLSVIETNIDDMNPEFYGHVMESLFSAGALDAWLTPIIMKKSRPAVKISALAPVELHDRIANILLAETSTFGVRSYEVDRKILDRSVMSLSSPWGKVRVKVGSMGGNILHISPEYEDCLRIAKEEGIPLKKVYDDIARLAEKKLGKG